MKDLDKLSITEIENEFVGNSELRLQIVINMKKYGGSFVVALSECIVMADENNLRKIAEAFVAYILEYQPKNWLTKHENEHP